MGTRRVGNRRREDRDVFQEITQLRVNVEVDSECEATEILRQKSILKSPLGV